MCYNLADDPNKFTVIPLTPITLKFPGHEKAK